MRGRAIAVALGMALAAVLACGRDEPAAPTLNSVYGHVVLTGYEVRADGRPAGTRVIGDADGVKVDLYYGTERVQSTLTVDGIYRFDGLGRGGYVARTEVLGVIYDQTLPFTMVDYDIAIADTLRLRAVGDLLPVPNPSAGSVAVYFDLPTSQECELDVRDLSGTLVRRVLRTRLEAGLQERFWDGRDEQNRLVGNPTYWLILESDGELRAHLVFRR